MVMSHVQKESVDGSVETRPHSVKIDNRHLVFVFVTIPNLTLDRQSRAWGPNPCLTLPATLKFMTFCHYTMKLVLLRIISIDPTQKFI